MLIKKESWEKLEEKNQEILDEIKAEKGEGEDMSLLDHL
jgi:hypothetical protein